MTAKYKVFGIGFHKTGTTSLAAALRRLGYSVSRRKAARLQIPRQTDREQSRSQISEKSEIGPAAWEKCKQLITEYDAFQDNPWPIFYKELYDHCPQGKFILTVRSPESWLKSIVGHAGDKSTPMREWIYGAGNPKGNEQLYLERYQRHNREVLEFFDNKEGSLLVMDIAAGDGWEKLCGFLDKWPVPTAPFPHKKIGGRLVAAGRPSD